MLLAVYTNNPSSRPDSPVTRNGFFVTGSLHKQSILISSSPLHSCGLLHSILRETNRTMMDPKDTLHLCTHPQTIVHMLKTRQAKHTQQLFFCNSLTKTIQQYDMCENRDKLTFPSANPHSVLVLFTSCYTHGNAEQVKPKECSAQRSSFAWRKVHSLGQTAKTDPTYNRVEWLWRSAGFTPNVFPGKPWMTVAVAKRTTDQGMASKPHSPPSALRKPQCWLSTVDTVAQ